MTGLALQQHEPVTPKAKQYDRTCAMKCKYSISVRDFQKGSLGLPFHPYLRFLRIIQK